MKADLFVA